MARLNISIPDELKARMDALGSEMNWSEIARAAFEATTQDREGLVRQGARMPSYPAPILDLRNTHVRIQGKRYPVVDLFAKLTDGVQPID